MIFFAQFGFEVPGTSGILKPLIETSAGGWEVDETEIGNPPEKVKASVEFTKGPLSYDTRTGFEIDVDAHQIDLPRLIGLML